MTTNELNIQNKTIVLYGKQLKLKMRDYDFKRIFGAHLATTAGGTPIHELLLETMELEPTRLFGIQTERIIVNFTDHELTDVEVEFEGDGTANFEKIKELIYPLFPKGRFAEIANQFLEYEDELYTIWLRTYEEDGCCLFEISDMN